jgi:metal-sulfur cluster biosynthetic enzyme
LVTEEIVKDMLMDVLDPEIQIDVVNLGMIYGIEISPDERTVHIKMTLTTMGCPLYEEMKEKIIERVKLLDNVEEVVVELTYDPPWNSDMMSDEAKMVFRYLF